MTAIDWNGVSKTRRHLEAIACEHPELLAPPSQDNRRGWEIDLEDIMGRPPTSDEPTVQVAFRLPDSLIDRLDEYVEHMKQSNRGVRFPRADAVRFLLSRALDADAEARKRKA